MSDYYTCTWYQIKSIERNPTFSSRSKLISHSPSSSSLKKRHISQNQNPPGLPSAHGDVAKAHTVKFQSSNCSDSWSLRTVDCWRYQARILGAPPEPRSEHVVLWPSHLDSRGQTLCDRQWCGGIVEKINLTCINRNILVQKLNSIPLWRDTGWIKVKHCPRSQRLIWVRGT